MWRFSGLEFVAVLEEVKNNLFFVYLLVFLVGFLGLGAELKYLV